MQPLNERTSHSKCMMQRREDFLPSSFRTHPFLSLSLSDEKASNFSRPRLMIMPLLCNEKEEKEEEVEE